MEEKNEKWDLIVEPKSGLFKLNLKEVWKYKDLILLFVRRDFVSVYKQTVLGPLWYIIQPLLLTLTYTFFFGMAGNLSTGGLPKFLWYLSGQVIWNFFSMSFSKTATTFTSNAGVFGKVYFPRLVTPISIIISNYIAQAIQFIIFLVSFIIFAVKGFNFNVQWLHMIGLIYILVVSSLLAFGLGIIISAITTKYRDFTFLITIGIQMVMYGSTVIFDTNDAKMNPAMRQVILLNPMSSLINYFRHIFFGVGYVEYNYLVYSGILSLFVTFFGIIIFSKVEKSFMDTV
jgi:lipopolysaccharide transport system permease protein